MKEWLADATANKKTSPEKLAATQVMLSCKSFKMTTNKRDYFNVTCWICLFEFKEGMLKHEKNYAKSMP